MPAKKKTSLSHIGARGEARMVDVSAKKITRREARAGGRIWMSAQALRALKAGDAPKGDVLSAARLAAIGAAKQTAQLIPLCHPLPLEKAEARFVVDEKAGAVACETHIVVTAKTGAEMEALCAAQIGLLTVYDMLKAVDREMVIGEVRLLEKSGGRSGSFKREAGKSGGAKKSSRRAA